MRHIFCRGVRGFLGQNALPAGENALAALQTRHLAERVQPIVEHEFNARPKIISNFGRAPAKVETVAGAIRKVECGFERTGATDCPRSARNSFGTGFRCERRSAVN